MNYDEYVRIQTSSPIKKPLHYRLGERRAIEWFFKDVSRDRHILDVGCGTGVGMKKLLSMGFDRVSGIDLNTKKIELCKRKGLNVGNFDVEKIEFYYVWHHIIWLSHSFEHVFNPSNVIQSLKNRTDFYEGQFFFVLPYPDLTPAPAHTASVEIGSNIDDGGKTLIQWFEDQGLELIVKKFDTFREKEIWLKFRKNK